MSEYHYVFVPLPDIYREGGIDVFESLGRSNGQKNLVVVPAEFVEEMGRMKEAPHGEGANDVLKHLSEMRFSANNGGVVLCETSPDLDIALLQCAGQESGRLSLKDLDERVSKIFTSQHEGRPVFISSDPVDRVLHNGTGIIVQEPRFLQVSADIVHEGVIMGNEELYERVHQEREAGVSLDDAVAIMGRDLFVNQVIKFRSGEERYEYARITADLTWNRSHTRIIDTSNGRVRLLPSQEYNKKIHIGDWCTDKLFGIAPRDMEQYIALQHGLLNPDISLFFLCGSQGSGKTLLSYVAAMDSVLWYNKDINTQRRRKGSLYKQVVLLKPTEVMGGERRNLGFLPGSLFDKLKPHLAPYIDAHQLTALSELFPFEELLRHPRFENEFGRPRNVEMRDLKIEGCAHFPADTAVFEFTYSGFMRGRSFDNTLVLIDEAQNFTPYELKTLIERLGEGSKAIIMGDPAQFDNPHCTRQRNGLTHAIKHFWGKPYVGLVSLVRNYRSQASEDARAWRAYSQ